ncbi:Endoribonuclease L-PSP/chorismate mutase-like protein [Microdochium bolleyi]|uniref:Endoribonuclease L-PSP/chorismate mutase-like protein n=1 Tax=Microdochium bolleyi TaxID=196109 RepID=A0A136IYW1_9PEZI|nr:Endoribonuclease L-PSP/chorismate mutase-like protein [Microdochium bolleyi]
MSSPTAGSTGRAPAFFTYPGYGETLLQEMRYNQAVRIEDRIETAGQGGWNPTTGEIPASLTDEIDQAFANVDLALRAAGGQGWSQVYRIRLYALDEAMVPEGLGRMVENIDKWCGGGGGVAPSSGGSGGSAGEGDAKQGERRRPILTGVGVSMLGQPGMRIEIEVAAYAP